MTPQLTVAVLTYNGEQLLPDCLTSIFQQTFPVSTELLILDNGSEEPVSWPLPCTPTSYPKNLERVRIERVEPNCGNIGGQNRCFEQARGKWVLFVANDVRMRKGCLQALGESGIGTYYNIAQPILLTPDNQIDNAGLTWWWPGYGRSQRNTHRLAHRTAMASTCYVMEKELWTLTGGFDEQLQSSHEDIDFCLRARKLMGCFTLEIAIGGVATHLGNATLKHTLPNHRAAFHRARRMVIRKHYHGLDRWTRLGAEWVIYYLTGGT